MDHQFICHLAQGASAPLLPEPAQRSALQQLLGSPEFQLVLGLAAVLTAAVFVWALIIRKRRPADPHLRVLEPGRVGSSGSKEGHGHRRRRRRRSNSSREHRNPTLQETGGLPPPRPEDQPPGL